MDHPKLLEISHLCHNPGCLHPGHLIIEHPAANNRRSSCNRDGRCTNDCFLGQHACKLNLVRDKDALLAEAVQIYKDNTRSYQTCKCGYKMTVNPFKDKQLYHREVMRHLRNKRQHVTSWH